MRLVRRLIVPMFGCYLTAAFGFAQPSATAGAPRIMQLRGDEDGELATRFTEILEDRSGTLDFDTVRSTETGWVTGPTDALNFGFSKSVWWVRLRLENSAAKRAPISIDLGNPRQDYIHWFVLRNSGTFLEENTTGDRLPFAHRALPARNFMLPLVLAPQERIDLFVRLESFDGLFEVMPLKVSQRERSLANTTAENQLLALFHGGIAALALYNLLLFLVLRERTFGFYVLYLFCFSIWSFTFRGFSFQYLWPQSPAFNNDFLAIITALTFATLGMFAIAYLRIRDLAPRWLYRLNQGLVIANLLVAIPALTSRYALSAALGLSAGTAISIVTLGSAIWLLTQGSRQARFFVMAFTVASIGAMAYVLQVISVVPTSWFTTWGVQIGSVIEVLLLALGLADSMNELKAQKIVAERQAREAQEALNAQLARQVNESTEALELANRRLHELAITDELTGAFNRKHFSAFCGAALAHRDRDEPLAFCIFDIDRFKSYNERYDLEAGNTALRQIAHAVRGELRRSGDVLFRLGGEEFGILFTASSPETTKLFVERLCAAVRNLNIQHENDPNGVLTASFGIGWWDKGVTDRLTPNQIYAVADNMLYEAKEAGRNQVKLDVHYATGQNPAIKVARQ